MWTYTNPDNTKVQIDYILVNKKWINSALNCEIYSSFGGESSDHRIVTVKKRLSLRGNAAQTTTTAQYDWSLLKKRDISDRYTITLRNKFGALQEILETLTPNDEYKNFVNAHMEAAAECIPTKLRALINWETLIVKKKCDHMKAASLYNRRNPTDANTQKLKKAQSELNNAYLKKQIEYIHDQINKIRNSVEDRQSRIAWQTVNEVLEGKTPREPNQMLPAKMNEYTRGNNISRIC